MVLCVRLLLLALFAFTGYCNAEYLCDTGELRLVNGSGGMVNNNGRLEFCRNGVWGTVSDYEFDMADARVACRKLGFNPDGAGLSFSGGAPYGEGSGQVFMGYLHCQGTEDQLLDCQYENKWIGNDHSHDVGITCPYNCTQGTLRLTGGYIPTEGTLEVCNNGAWNSICGDEFQRQDGFVACRQLGYPANSTQVTSYRFNNGHGSPTWTKFQCYGNESALSDCPYTNSICEAYNTATANFAIVGLKCEGEIVTANSCINGDIRLNGPTNNAEGRIEVCSNGAWGTVTSENFGAKDGLTACRQLGYASPSVRVYPPAYFGDDASGPILMNNLACLGSEQNLYQCNQDRGTSYAASHSNDATIWCWTKNGDTCTDYAIRLRNDSGTQMYGRLEVCRFQEWGSICDDGWDRNDARTICTQLGITPSYASFYTGSTFGDGYEIPVILTNIDCDSSDSTFSTCGRNDQIETNCNFGHTAGVRCFGSDSCTSGDIRLTGGKSDREGDVQICRDGKWGYVCSDSWSIPDANVVCRQLGYSETWNGFSTTGLFGGSQDIAPLVYDRADCSGSENTLGSCSFAEYGSANPQCTQIAGVMCTESSTTCNNWDVRLVDGATSGDGRVEICFNSIWTTVDTNNWDYNSAKVVCRAQNYDADWAVALSNSQFGSGNRRIVYHNFQCVGSESNLQGCNSLRYSSSAPLESWYNSVRAGVSCRRISDAETCTQAGAIRLKDGSSARQGRLEVCVNGYWGSVCSTGWTRDNSLVACRNAGYETTRPILTQGAYSEQGQGPVNLANVVCAGNEDNLYSECTFSSGIGLSNCYHGNDVGLICSETPANYYNITVTTSPDPTDIPIGTQVQLTCNSAPTPPNGVTYEWRSTITEDPIVQNDPSSPSAVVTISHKHPKVSHYYCAMKWNDEVLAIGTVKLTIRNFLVPVQPSYTVASGGSVTLTITPMSTSIYGIEYLRNLQWYFHGAPIGVFYTGDYSISSDGLSLTLNGITEIYAGQYSLQYDGLSLYRYSAICEQNLMEFLRDYPLFAPAIITVQVGSVNLPDTSLASDSILVPGSTLTSYKKGTDYVVLTTHTSYRTTSDIFSLQWNEFSMGSFSSGAISGLHVASGLLSPITSPHYTLDFIAPTVLQTGYYETQLTAHPSYLLNTIGCGSRDGYGYADFMNTQLGFTGGAVLGSAKQAIAYYETPSAQLTTSGTAFVNSSNVTVTCSSQGGYPLYYNLSIIKNSMSVASMIGSPTLAYNTLNDATGYKYGRYWCLVNNLYDTDSTSVLLKEQALMTLSFDVGSCSSWPTATKDMFLDPIMSSLTSACNCTLSGSTLTIDSLVCTTNYETERAEVTINSTLIYSNDDGDQTSLTVFQNLYDIFDMGNNLTFIVSNQTLTVKWPLDMPGNPVTLPEAALLTLLFVAGFIASTLIFVMVIVIVCFVKRRKEREAATKAAPPVAFHKNPQAMQEVVVQSDEEERDEDEEWELPGDSQTYQT